MAANETPIGTEWLHPPEEQGGLQAYVETLRERARLIAAVALAVTVIAMLYVLLATKIYEARAELLVTPISGDNPTLGSLGLIQQSNDPTRSVETVATLVEGINVATLVKEELGYDGTAEELRDTVRAEPVAQSDIVAITASDSSPEQAEQVANAFAEQAVAERTRELHEKIDSILPALEVKLLEDPEQSLGSNPLSALVAELELLRNAPDPTVRVNTLASTPVDPSSPKVALSIALGLFSGLILGVVAAFASQALDPRLRRESQLRRSYQLPILTRVPVDSAGGTGSGIPLNPGSVSPATSEAYRTLRANVMLGARRDRGRVILVTGSSASEGKTTTAINLASSLASAGRSCILIESDLRRPSMGLAVKSVPEHGGIVSVLIDSISLSEALVPSPTMGNMLRVLLADYEGGWISDLFSIPAASQMVEEARGMAEFVIIDSPPLNEVVDALPLARMADDVLIVTRLGTTRLDKLFQLAELLAGNGVRPRGFALVGQGLPGRSDYYYTSEDSPGLRRRETGADAQPGRAAGTVGSPGQAS